MSDHRHSTCEVNYPTAFNILVYTSNRRHPRSDGASTLRAALSIGFAERSPWRGAHRAGGDAPEQRPPRRAAPPADKPALIRTKPVACEPELPLQPVMDVKRLSQNTAAAE